MDSSYGGSAGGKYGSATDYLGSDGGGLAELSTGLMNQLDSVDKKIWIGIAVVASLLLIGAVIFIVYQLVAGTNKATEGLLAKTPMIRKRLSTQAVDQKLYDSLLGL